MKTKTMKIIKLNYIIYLILCWFMYVIPFNVFDAKEYGNDEGYWFFEEDKMQAVVWVGLITIITLILIKFIYKRKSRIALACEMLANIVIVGFSVNTIYRIKFIFTELDKSVNKYISDVLSLGIVVMWILIALVIVNIFLYVKALLTYENTEAKIEPSINYRIDTVLDRIRLALGGGVLFYSLITILVTMLVGHDTFTEPCFTPRYALEIMLITAIIPLLIFFFAFLNDWIMRGTYYKKIIGCLLIIAGLYNALIGFTKAYACGILYHVHHDIFQYTWFGVFAGYFAIVMLFIIGYGIKSKKK